MLLCSCGKYADFKNLLGQTVFLCIIVLDRSLKTRRFSLVVLNLIITINGPLDHLNCRDLLIPIAAIWAVLLLCYVSL